MQDKVKVFVNGTFDVLHLGHLAMLNYAKSLGDLLIVAIDSDERVRRLKGHDRPINSFDERKIMLENLKSVDEVKIFDTDEELINIIKTCDIMVKGSDYETLPIIGGGLIKVVLFDRIDEYSSTKKIQDIIDRG
jgi:D-beta-D-heptose 7-phosphate kinase/D-beta-D-heptose 1-phosphate adenosyltransferase